jgi:nucleoside-diphosphate-sugar epimerase
MKVVITGATGAVAPHVVTELEAGHSLTLFARRPLESKHAAVAGDLRSEEPCRRALAGAQAVIHLGGNSVPAPEAFEVNVVGTYRLLEAAREAGVERFIFASSNCVYGHCFRVTARPFPLEFLPIDETHSCCPEDNYGLSKVLAEKLLANYSQTWGMRTAALRLNWVWGPGEIEWRGRQTAADMEKQAPYFWAYVDARDTARAFRLALEAPDLPAYGAYNISAADHMADEASAELCARWYPGTPLRGEIAGRASFFDSQAARRAFGYEPRYTWRDGWNR